MASNISINPGILKHKITIQNKTDLVDKEGVPIETWSDFITTMAAYEPVSGREYFIVESTNALNTAVFRIRYRKGITPSMRLISSFGIFNINYVIDVDGRHREIQLMCTSEVKNG